jgi:hypothetical protein
MGQRRAGGDCATVIGGFAQHVRNTSTPPQCRCMQLPHLAGDGPRPVRAGSAWPLSPGRSVRRGSKIKRDFACTFASTFYLCVLSCGHSHA